MAMNFGLMDDYNGGHMPSTLFANSNSNFNFNSGNSANMNSLFAQQYSNQYGHMPGQQQQQQQQQLMNSSAHLGHAGKRSAATQPGSDNHSDEKLTAEGGKN
jgi:hypothetical protein